eukprot:745054-Amphidinium_carterae.1
MVGFSRDLQTHVGRVTFEQLALHCKHLYQYRLGEAGTYIDASKEMTLLTVVVLPDSLLQRNSTLHGVAKY